MKDYTLGRNTRKRQILNYEKEDNMLIVNYAQDGKISYPYSIGIEIDILNKMREQIIDSDKDYEVIKKKIDICRSAIFYGMVVALPLMAGVLHFVLLKSLLGFVLSSGLFGLNGYFIKRRFKEIDSLKVLKSDMEKNRLFVDNELLFQSRINENMPLNTNMRKESINLIKNVYEYKKGGERVYPTINDIDKYSYETILEIYSLLKRGLEIDDEKNRQSNKGRIKIRARYRV